MSELSDSDIPSDLVHDILLRLPVKTIGRFRCVSKSWQSLLSNRQFLKTHQKHHPKYFIVKPRSSSGPAYIITPTTTAENSSNDAVAIKLPPELNWHTMVGSCHGLLLLNDGTSKLSLINPITSETVHINRDYENYEGAYGFGYDSSTDDYKIVSVLEFSYKLSAVINVDVYSLRMKRWKRIQIPSDTGTELSGGVYLNGRLHWYGYYDGNQEIACFDLAREKFVEGLTPDNVREERFHHQNIMDFDGCLALVSYIAEFNRYSVWVMKEYGVRDSWTEFTVICPENCKGDNLSYYYLVCELSEDEIVLEKDDEKLVAFDRKKGVFRDMVIAGLPKSGFCGTVMPFDASLLSPHI